MNEMWSPVWPAIAFVGATTVALALRATILAGLRRWSGPGPGDIRAGVRAGIRGPSLLWCIVLGLLAANEVALDAIPLPARWYTGVQTVLETVLVLSVSVAVASMADRGVARISESIGLSAGATGLAKTTARVGLLLLGLLALLSALWAGAGTSTTWMG